MPTLSNEEQRNLLKKYNWSGDRDYQIAVIALREMLATQNTALLKEVAKALPKPLKVNKTVVYECYRVQ